MSERPDGSAHAYDDLVELVRQVRRDGRSVVARGGGVLAAPDNRACACDMRPRAALLEHAHSDLTVTVQAGMTLATLRSLLADRAQTLLIDAPCPQRSTIGGIIAAGLNGPRSASAGGIRDLLLGLTFINADGELIRAGGRVVKNVAGYDLCKLFCGSWGWLGIVVEATLRLHAAPEHAAALLVPADTVDDVNRIAQRVLYGPFVPASIDLLLPAATIMIAFEGRRESVEDQLGACQAQLGGQAQPAQFVVDQRQAICDLLVADDAAIRFSAARADAAGLAFQVAAQCPSARVAAGLASGTLTIAVRAADAGGLRALTQRLAQDGVSWLIPTSRGVRTLELPMFGPPRSDWPLMKRVKHALDPARCFARHTPFDDVLVRLGEADKGSPPA